MEEIAGWIAPAATMIAAMMTAANLGPRVTGWGFAVFLVGSIAWTLVALASGQQNLLWTNAFLSLVNLTGIWRWLGRRARFDQGAHHAEVASRRQDGPSLFPVSGMIDAAVTGRDGRPLAHVVDAMARCGDGGIAYLILREGGAAGVGERLHALEWRAVRRCDDGFQTGLDEESVAALPRIEETAWPARA